MRTAPRTARPGAATDDIAGLGRLEQLVLRGDGLTTTSLEILTGTTIDVIVDEHRLLPLHDCLHALAASTAGHTSTAGHSGTPAYTGTPAPSSAEAVRDAFDLLEVAGSETLLVREIVHRGADGGRYGASRAVIVLDRLPAEVRETLARTDEPIGRALRTAGVGVVRELRHWGLRPAGARARRLSGALRPHQPVPSRRYVMRTTADGLALAAFTEWFAPCVFGR